MQGYRIKIRELASIASQGCIVRGSPVWSSIIREQKRPREALSGGEKLNAIALGGGSPEASLVRRARNNFPSDVDGLGNLRFRLHQRGLHL